jgi:hypothetical protein
VSLFQTTDALRRPPLLGGRPGDAKNGFLHHPAPYSVYLADLPVAEFVRLVRFSFSDLDRPFCHP